MASLAGNCELEVCSRPACLMPKRLNGMLIHSAPSQKRLHLLMASTLRQERKVFIPAGEKHPGNMLIASYNTHKCVGQDGRFDPDRTIAVIKEINADVIALQEVDQRFGDRAGLLDLRAVEHETGLVPVPVKGIRRSHGWHGNIILVRNARLVAADQLALAGGEPRGALIVDMTFPAGQLRVIAAHLGLLRRSRARQVEAILFAIARERDRPTVLMGDLNEWRLGRRSSLKALEPTFGPLHADVASFPARFPVWSLDRILANPHSLVSKLEVHDTPLARMASDHLPIKASIRIGLHKVAVEEIGRFASAA